MTFKKRYWLLEIRCGRAPYWHAVFLHHLKSKVNKKYRSHTRRYPDKKFRVTCLYQQVGRGGGEG